MVEPLDNVYYGAQHNLTALITTHLFVISPNNSGSTFVKNVLATCSGTWNLRREGQHAFGFGGPTPNKLKIPYLWASEQQYLDALTQVDAFNWEAAKKAWYFQAFSSNPAATVFVEKSPPFLLHVEQLSRHFHNAKFLFMVRNPYAMAEGILRAAGWFYPTRAVAVKQAAIHIVNCLRFQKSNLARFPNDGLFFTYEQLCAEPERLQTQIAELVPELGELVLQQQVSVKGNYDEPLRNMNEQQVSRLSSVDFDTLNEVFAPEQGLLQSFGYGLHTP